jgi:hypothetical protein
MVTTKIPHVPNAPEAMDAFGFVCRNNKKKINPTIGMKKLPKLTQMTRGTDESSAGAFATGGSPMRFTCWIGCP